MTTTATPLGAILALMGACTLEPEAALPPEATAEPACLLRHDGRGYTAVLTSAAPVSGDYALSLSGPGLTIRQAGPFEADAGETVVLGRAGVPPVAEARLVVTVDGRQLACGEG